MYYVMVDPYGECVAEVESLEEAERICESYEGKGEGAWICSDEDDWDEPSDLEMGFDPYEGCYSFDC